AEGLEAYRGKWVLLTSDSPRCDEACAKRLYLIRQIRLTQGKDKERVERVLLLSEPGKAAFVVEGVESLEKVHEGMHQLYLEPEKRARLMGIATGELAAGTVPDKGIFLVDPLGHVMMRFPEDPDPSRMKKDLSKLLKWSRVG
ncbi:MAG: cytochrome C oxidase subunit I, partial [Betaproteobacteria bacterium]|nr:cytochrome C oxidase subunit I [Betaproteobacteria bacterium]